MRHFVCACAAATALACGAVGPPPLDGPGGAGPATAGQPPRVVRMDPADEQKGVRTDSRIAIHFSQKMDRTSAEAAFSSPQIESAAFTWNDDGTTMFVQSDELLPWAVGGLDVKPARIDVHVSNSARALGDDAYLIPFSARFHTERVVTVDLRSDYLLDGYVRYDGSVVSCGVDTQDGAICVGDSETADMQYKGLLTFDLAGVPDGVLEVLDAQVAVYQYRVDGSPYDTLGVLELEHLEYAKPESAFKIGALDKVGILSRDPTVGWKAVEDTTDLRRVVEEDLARREARGNKSQYRMVFRSETDRDTSGDVAKFYPAKIALSAGEHKDKGPRLAVTVSVP